MIDFTNDTNFIKPNVEIDFNHNNSSNIKNTIHLLEKKYKINKTQIELFNGFSSAIYSLLKFLNLKFCFIYSPCDLEYKKAAKNLSYDARLINRFENLFLPIKESSLVIFANPSYLDGTYYNLENLIDYWISKDATILLDETLLDFCNEFSYIEYLEKYQKIYILKDFSKYYGNKNLNITTVFSSKKNIENLRKIEPNHKISAYDLSYINQCFEDRQFKLISNSINTNNKIELEKIVDKCKYINFSINSNTNSILIKLKDTNSKKFKNRLSEKKVKIPNCLKYDFIDDSFINIFVNSKNDILKLKEILLDKNLEI